MMHQLRNCSARYSTSYEGITGIITEYGEIYEYAKNAKLCVLVSYSSIVAIYDKNLDTLFLLPRWDYSVTTRSHICKFAEDVIGCTIYKNDIDNGEKCGTTIIKCWGYLFYSSDKVYKY